VNIEKPKLIVITPVKNEDWILDRFLSITSRFADHIIIADQESIDRSIEICKTYEKVIIVNNASGDYSESKRQKLLLDTARTLVTGPKIILALDADEIMAADSIQSLGWQSMMNAKPGTVIWIERLNICPDFEFCYRYDKSPIGYVDDGAEHIEAKEIHSVRIPMPDYANFLILNDVKVLHYHLTRPFALAAKKRLYTVVENVTGRGNILSRRNHYSSKKNDYNKPGRLENVQDSWFAGWQNIGLDLTTIIESKYHWHDFQVLQYFQKYGCEKFWMEDIWRFDWEACRNHAISLNIRSILEPEKPIPYPPKLFNPVLDTMSTFYEAIRERYL
jgi:glycosyltransferase involved in cell wall biosynthesis